MKKILIGIGIVFICMIVVFLLHDNTSVTKRVINYNGNNLRISVDGQLSSILPTNGTYYLTDYDCSNTNTKVSWNKDNYKLNVSNGDNKGGVSCYLEFKSNPLLSEMQEGSYVAYTGDSSNGCDNTNMVNGYSSCSGKNANYVSDLNMGYCNDSNYKFHVNGWRIGYIEKGSVHLISAGAPECMCTESSGVTGQSDCSGFGCCSTYVSNLDMYKHYNNMNNIALKYCNSDYSKGGLCNETTSWGVSAIDFEKITGSVLSSSSCFDKYSSIPCGWTNDLIDNGSLYWFATFYSSTSLATFSWDPIKHYVHFQTSNSISGVRPVLYLDSSVVVTGGSGTYTDPYTIGNNTFFIMDNGSVVTDSSNTSLTLELMSVGATQMCISTDTSVCTNYIDFSNSYALDLSGYGTGEHLVYVYYKNSNGNIIASIVRSIMLV